jgi:hypothetical protein
VLQVCCWCSPNALSTLRSPTHQPFSLTSKHTHVVSQPTIVPSPLLCFRHGVGLWRRHDGVCDSSSRSCSWSRDFGISSAVWLGLDRGTRPRPTRQLRSGHARVHLPRVLCPHSRTCGWRYRHSRRHFGTTAVCKHHHHHHLIVVAE